MINIAIVGAGASGLMAALVAKNSNNRVDLYEKNPKIAKKIAISGNGRCNISNLNLTKESYFGNDLNFLSYALKEFGYEKFKKFCLDLGLYLVELDDGRVYPSSFESLSVISLLEQNLKQKGVEINLSHRVKDVKKIDSKFAIYVKDDEPRYYDIVLISSGSKAAEKMSEDDLALKVAKNFGHNVYERYPILVQLESDYDKTHLLAGVKIDAKVETLKGDVVVFGDVLFTKYGLSGFAILDISPYVSKMLIKQKRVEIQIDLLPRLDKDKLQAIFSKTKKNHPDYSCEMMLQGVLPYKIAKVLTKDTALFGKKLIEINTKDIKRLVFVIKEWRWSITRTHGFKYAEACGGGIDTTHIDPKTMESKLVKGLYFSGEVLDIVGKRGGYNLSFAWMSGYLAGKALYRNKR